MVSVEDGSPVLQLDDLVVLLRNTMSTFDGRFGCSIVPREANLAAVQDFLRDASARSLRPGERSSWIAELRRRLGRQDIRVEGIDPRSRVARVIVEADYHMKLIGMGLQDGTLGVSSYLSSVTLNEDGTPPAMDVLRWWFTMDYDSLRTTESRDAFELRCAPFGCRAKTRCWPIAAAVCTRVRRMRRTSSSPGTSRAITRSCRSSTRSMPNCGMYLIWRCRGGDSSREVVRQIQWKMPFFGVDGEYQVDSGVAPTEVDSVVNCRVLDARRFVVGVSGGVTANAGVWVSRNMATDDRDLPQVQESGTPPREPLRDRWWWD